MAKVKYSNPEPGARGVIMKDGTTVWIEPGATAELEKSEVSSAYPTLTTGDRPADAAAAS